MYLWAAAIGVATLGFLYTVIRLNILHNSQYQTHSDAKNQSSDAKESNIELCETCKMPQRGDEKTWKKFQCGHCFHQHCLNLYASSDCITCEFNNLEREEAIRRMGDSQTK